jgi:hypothetical protein
MTCPWQHKHNPFHRKVELEEKQQARLEVLAEVQKQRSLTATEQAALAQLMEAAQHVMLRKAEVYRLLTRRGHTVFTPPEPLSD